MGRYDAPMLKVNQHIDHLNYSMGDHWLGHWLELKNMINFKYGESYLKPSTCSLESPTPFFTAKMEAITSEWRTYINSRLRILCDISMQQDRDVLQICKLLRDLRLDTLPEWVLEETPTTLSFPDPHGDAEEWRKGIDAITITLLSLSIQRRERLRALQQELIDDENNVFFAAVYTVFDDPQTCTCWGGKDGENNPSLSEPYFEDSGYPNNQKAEADKEMKRASIPRLEIGEAPSWVKCFCTALNNDIVPPLGVDRMVIIEFQRRLDLLKQAVEKITPREEERVSFLSKLFGVIPEPYNVREELLDRGSTNSTTFPCPW